MVVQHLASSPKSPQIPPKSPIRVELLALQDVQLLDVAGPLQVFSSANQRLARRGREPGYTTRIVTPGSDPVHTRYDRCAHTFMSAICIAAVVISWI
jgi:transcriptional regulator GlxA family with amidase domain